MVNALVLVRTPEDEEAVVSSLKEALDKRFRITLLTILDPKDLNISLEEVKGYQQIKSIEAKALEELSSICRRLRSQGFECQARVSVGPLGKLLEAEASSDENDLVVLIRRRGLRPELEHRMDSVATTLSRFKGKLMVIRRP